MPLPHPIATVLVLGVAALVMAPLASLIHIALQGDEEIWAHLAAYVLPHALTNTLLLLAGVAAVTAIVGVGTAWIVTAYQFPARAVFGWLLPLPLAIPTYIVAYVYVDIFDTLGPVHELLRSIFGWHSPTDYPLPNIRSLGGAIFVMGFVLYPYVYLATRAMFQTQNVALIEMARALGANDWQLARDIMLPLARPAIAVGLALAGSSAAVVIAYTVRFLAIATGFAQAGLARISTELDDVARTSGARPSGVVRSIHLPLMRPALGGAALLVFVDCLKELPATLLLRPLNVETLSTYLYQFATRGNFEEGSLAALLIVLVGIFPVIRMVRHTDDALQARVRSITSFA